MVTTPHLVREVGSFGLSDAYSVGKAIGYCATVQLSVVRTAWPSRMAILGCELIPGDLLCRYVQTDPCHVQEKLSRAACPTCRF